MNTVKRRAPKNGYDNSTKSKYRHNVWKNLSEGAIPILNENENAKVLILPSKEGIEIDVAIKFGIKPEQIIAVDENPALLAHAKWKYKIPKENRFGCKVSKIGRKIKDNGWFLACANLDFCNQISEELVSETNSFLDTTPISDNFSFFVTFMKGRESKALYLLLKQRNASNIFKHERLSAFYELINWPIIHDYYWACDFEETYVSNRAPMVYACFKSVHGNITSDSIKSYEERLEVLGNRYSNIDKCKVGRNGNYRNKSDKIHRIKDAIKKESDHLLNKIMNEKINYANEKCIIEKEAFLKDHSPKLYTNCTPHYSGYSFSRGYNKKYW